ncbi:MAG: YdcH family protein [Polyangiaceae bacterium]|nr:YdcH family protein [Polyangiaceae bacterium]
MKQQVISPRVVDVGTEQRLSLVEARHRELDARLKELGRHAYLTPAEQIEAAELKKMKLLAKDEIADLRRRRF